MEKFSFEVATRPLKYDSIQSQVAEDEGFKVIIRDDNSKVLSVMKSSYCELLNTELEKIAKEIVKISNFKILDHREFKGGKIVFVILENTQKNVVLFGKNIKDYLLLGSSHDGSYPFFIGTTFENLWCENQFSRISRITRIRHTSSSEQKRRELTSLVEIYFKQRSLVYENFNKFQKIEIPEELRQEVLARILGIKREDMLEEKVSTRKLNQLELIKNAYELEAGEYGHTLYAMLNATTRYTTHSLNSKDKVFGNFHGVPNWLNEKAYKIGLGMVESLKIV